jgi:[histone H3]-trimethyl-L-lysine4 demethylase
VPPNTWTPPPFSLSLSSFPTKSQPIHRLQSRLSSSDPSTFRLDYLCFLTSHLQRKPPKKSPIFEGEPLDLCHLFNAVKRFGGYNVVCQEKRWADVAQFIQPVKKVSECAKHVLSQLYYEHLYDYEIYNDRKNKPEKSKMEFHTRNKRKKISQNLVQEAENFSNEEFDQICEQCNSGLHGEVMLLCDRCNKGWHIYCLTPPLESVPSGNWYCLECINSDQDSFGFVPGKNRSLEEFQRMDDKMRRKWFGQRSLTRSQIEKKFWEIVEGKVGSVEVLYGSDLDTSIYGSGFPRPGDPCPPNVDPDLWKEYSGSPWNLNNFAKLPCSILRTVKDITGVIVPWLYVGMLFSAFCWHVEDHCFYSINYLHW